MVEFSGVAAFALLAGIVLVTAVLMLLLCGYLVAQWLRTSRMTLDWRNRIVPLRRHQVRYAPHNRRGRLADGR